MICSLQRLILLFLLLSHVLLLRGQDIPATYQGTAQYILGSDLDTAAITKIEAHLRMLNQKEADSLRITVFPAIEEKAREESEGFQAYLYETLLLAAYQLLGNLELSLTYMEKQIESLRKSGQKSSLLRAYSQKMFLLADLDSTNSAFQTSLKVRDLLVEENQPSQKSFIYRQLCVFYQRIGETQRGLDICDEAIDFMTSQDSKRVLGDIYETIALLKDKEGAAIEEVIEFRRQAIKYAIVNEDSFNLRTMCRNLALSYVKLNENDSAQKYFDLTFKIYEHYPYFFGWVYDQATYAEFLLDQGKPEKAKPILDTLRLIYERAPEHSLSLMRLAELNMKFSVWTNNYSDFKQSFALRDSLLSFDFEKEKLKAREEMATRYETEKKEAENQLLKAENRSRLIGLMALAGMVVLLIILVTLIIQRRKRDKKIYRQEQELLSLQLQNTIREKELAKAKSTMLRDDLQVRIKQVMEQQVINSELMEMIEDLRSEEESPVVRKKTSQMKTMLSEQITLRIFEEIYDKMRDLYPELFRYLKNAIGEDKENEIISTAMYFMGYETRDIAKILQKTEKAIRNMRYRVRKKLGLSDSEDLIEYLVNLQSNLA